MRLVFIGPPGAGKGTQAQVVSGRLGLDKISTGDILRDAVRNKTALGLKAKEYMDKGNLVPDQLVIDLIRERLGNDSCDKGYLLDGFPRSLVQAESLARILDERGESLDRVILFEISNDELVRRLSGRRSCGVCKEVYHVEFHPPEADNKCDSCGSVLIQREDDKVETVKSRLKVYREETEPLIAYYNKKGLISKINGHGEIGVVSERICRAISS